MGIPYNQGPQWAVISANEARVRSFIQNPRQLTLGRMMCALAWGIVCGHWPVVENIIHVNRRVYYSHEGAVILRDCTAREKCARG